MSSRAVPGPVRAQYEAYPYPERDPQEEHQRLFTTWPEQLAQINHYCFRGRQDFRSGFRALVAGGGTGDATVYLAAQLADTDASVVYLDVSRASAEVARRRAAARGLPNIRFVHGSLLDLPAVLEAQDVDRRFDYISCTGVLHHLDEPEAGLERLLDVLAPGGALNIVLYGRYGREAVYQLQALLRLLDRDGADMPARLARAKAVLASLSPAHGWHRHPLSRNRAMSDAELVDLFLHPQDRAYTLPEIHEWFEERCGLHLQFSRLGMGRLPYLPERYVSDPALLERIGRLPGHEQRALAELLAGDMDLHCFFATREADSAASLDELDNVPFFCGGLEHARGPELAAAIGNHPGANLQFTDARTGLSGWLAPGRYSASILRHLDGERSLREIFASVRSEDPARAALGEAELLEDFRPVFQVFNVVDGMLLRHRSVPRFATAAELAQQLALRTA